MIFSIVICTHNGELSIEKTINSIINVDFYCENFEVIIIDNNCTDNTNYLCNKLLSESNINYKIIKEHSLGLSNARIRGIIESSGEYILFCDDDNIINNDYLKSLEQKFSSDKKIGVIQGTVMPIFEKQPENWIFRYLRELGLDNSSGDVFGTGFCFRSSILKFLILSGFNNICQDRTNNEISSGGDDELISITRLIGYKSDKIESRVYHYCKSSKTTIKYISKLMYGIGYSIYVKNVLYGNNKAYIYCFTKLRYIDNYDKILSELLQKGFNDAKNSLDINKHKQSIKNIVDLWYKQ